MCLLTVQIVYKETLNERIDLLCRFPQFSKTKQSRLRDTAAAFTVLEFKAGQVLLTQGEGASFLGVVLSGTVDLIFSSVDNRGVLRKARIATLGPGTRPPSAQGIQRPRLNAT